MRYFLVALLFLLGFFSNSHCQDLKFISKGLPDQDIEKNSKFGKALALDKNLLVVGATDRAYLMSRNDGQWSKIGELLSETGVTGEGFGTSVAIYDSVIVIGAPNATVDGKSKAGRIYIYKMPAGGWQGDIPYNSIKTANTSIENNLFGAQVKILGDTIAIGAPQYSGDKFGKVYVLTNLNNNWSLNHSEGILQAFEPISNDMNYGFGNSIVLLPNLILVGSPNLSLSTNMQETSNFRNGAIYVFEKNSGPWTNMNETSILLSPEPKFIGLFGSSLSYHNNLLAIGQPNGGTRPDSASVFLYQLDSSLDWNNLTHKAKLSFNTEINTGSINILSVDSTIYVALASESTKIQRATVYVFNEPLTGWTDLIPNSFLTAGHEDIENYFGSALCGNDSILLAGYPSDNSQDNTGSVYEFIKSGDRWAGLNDQPIIFSYGLIGSAFDQLGAAVALSGNYAAVTARGDDENFNNSGAVYIFEKTNNAWVKIAKLTSPNVNMNGFGYSVDIYDKYVVVGAPEALGSRGLAYLFIKPETGWTDSSNGRLFAPNSYPLNGYRFGQSVSVFNDLIIVGTSGNIGGEPAIARLFKIEEDSIVQIQELDLIEGNLTRSPVDLFDNYIAIGGTTGKSFILNNLDKTTSSFIYDSTFVVDSYYSTQNDFSLGEKSIIVGSKGILSNGQVDLYQNSNNSWYKKASFSSSEISIDESFASKIRQSGDFILANNPLDNNIEISVGSTYLFKKPDTITTETITELHKIESPVIQAHLGFGDAIDIYGNTIIIGSRKEHNANGISAGAVYFYEIDQPYVQEVKSLQDGNYLINDTILFEIIFSEPVEVVGNPRIEIYSYNDIISSANYIRALNDNSLLFEYIFKDGDNPYYLQPKNRDSFLIGGTIYRKGSTIRANRILPPGKVSNYISDPAFESPYLIDSSYLDSTTGSTLLKLKLKGNERIVLFNSDSISVEGGELSDLYLEDNYLYGIITPDYEDSVIVFYKEGLVRDSLLIPNMKQVMIYYLAPPKPIIRTLAQFNSEGFATVKIEFNQPVNGFTEEDISIIGSSITSFRGEGKDYYIDLFSNDYGIIQLLISKNTCYNSTQLLNDASQYHQLIYGDPSPFTYLLSTSDPFELSSLYFSCQIQFSHPITNLLDSSFYLRNAVVESIKLVSPENHTYHISLIVIKDGQVEVGLKNASVSDIFGDFNELSVEPLYYAYDTEPPYVIAFTMEEEIVPNRLKINIEFNEIVFDFFTDPLWCTIYPDECFNFDDVEIFGATVAGFSGGFGNYQISLIPSIFKNITLQIPSGVAFDIVGKPNLESELYQIDYADGLVTNLGENNIELAYNISVRNSNLIVTHNFDEKVIMEIIDVRGNLIYKMENLPKELSYNLSNFKPGLFIVTLMTKDTSVSQKFIYSR